MDPLQLAARPESVGVPSAALQAFVATIEAACPQPHGLLVARRGQIVAETYWAPYRAGEPHQLYSVSKTFLSAALAYAAADWQLSLDDPVLDYFPAAASAAPSAALRALRLRHLLTMQAGHEGQTVVRLGREPDADWATTILAQPIAHEPGTRFLYDAGCSYLLAAALERVTEQRLVEYLRPRLWEPLSIGTAGAPPRWETCPRGVCVGGWGLELTLRELAAFGAALLANETLPQGPVLPRGWAEEAGQPRVLLGGTLGGADAQGYGWHSWAGPYGSWRASGAFGQTCLVWPAQHLLVVLLGGLADDGPLLRAVWQLGGECSPGPLAANPAGGAALRAALDDRRLALAPPATDARASDIAGDWRLADNPQGLTGLGVDLDTPALHLTGPAGTTTLPFGWGDDWRDGVGLEALGAAEGLPAGDERSAAPGLDVRAGYQAGGGRPVALAGGWLPDGALRLVGCFRHSPARLELTLRADGAGLRVERALHHSFAPPLGELRGDR